MDVETTKLKINAFLPQLVLATVAIVCISFAAYAPNGDWCGAVGIASAAVGGIAGLGKQAANNPPK